MDSEATRAGASELCSDCRFWIGPKAMTPEQEAIALANGVSRDGRCHRFPKAEATGAAYWCGEFDGGTRE